MSEPKPAAPPQPQALPVGVFVTGIVLTIVMYALVALVQRYSQHKLAHSKHVDVPLALAIGEAGRCDRELRRMVAFAVSSGSVDGAAGYPAAAQRCDAVLARLADLTRRDELDLADVAGARAAIRGHELAALGALGRGDADAAAAALGPAYLDDSAVFDGVLRSTSEEFVRENGEELEGFTRRSYQIIALALTGGLVLAIGWLVIMRSIFHQLQRVRDAEAQAQQARNLASLKDQEMAIAAHIQTSLVPRAAKMASLEISAAMTPAAEVGGDYYEVMPVPGGCWLAIGDVSGHGVTAGIIMLMVQSAFSALVGATPNASAKDMLVVLNRTLHENLRRRLGSDDHVTLSLVRYWDDGRLEWAGGHEEIIVCRATTGRCLRLDTPGPWVGVMKDVSKVAVLSESELEPDDVLVLYTDGVTEAMNAQKEQFGIDRLCAAIEAKMYSRPEVIRDHVLAEVKAWTHRQDDDVTLVVIQRRDLAANAA